MLHTILHDSLGFMNMCTQWVPKQFTEEHKTKHLGAALTFLQQYKEKRNEFPSCVIMGNESWIHQFMPETKQQSKIWRQKEELVLKNSKISTHLGR